MGKKSAFRESMDGFEAGRSRASHPGYEESCADHLRSLDGRVCPVSALLERGSDWSFVDNLIQEVQDYGLTAEQAEGVVEAVLGQPAVVASSRYPVDKEYFSLAVLDEPVADTVSVVTASFKIDGAKPPLIHDLDLQLHDIDLDSEDGAMGLLVLLERQQRRLGLPRLSKRPATEPRTVIWAGDPNFGGYWDIPPDWPQLIRSMGIVLAVDTVVITTPAEFKHKAAQDSDQLVIFVDGVDREKWDDVIDFDQVEIAGQPGTRFEDLLGEVRNLVFARIGAVSEGVQTEPVILSDGQHVYHRKIGSGGSADVFDAGRDHACKHGAGGYIKFTKAPKALKGMQRRYENFTEDNLYHCGKFPACGMYLAKGANPPADADGTADGTASTAT